jgi:8-oxo-dGTP diphosphatase
MNHRKRGTAIVETEKGILLVAGKSKNFMLPGGATERHEMRVHASMRELNEETGLKPIYAEPIFHYEGKVHNGYNGKFKDYHTVCIVKAKGHPKPKSEIKYIAYHTGNDSKINLSNSTKEIIEKYLKWKEEYKTIFGKIKYFFKKRRFYYKKPSWHHCNPPKWAKRILDNNAGFNSLVTVKGKHYQYSLKVKAGNIQGDTEWIYMKRKLLK